MRHTPDHTARKGANHPTDATECYHIWDAPTWYWVAYTMSDAIAMQQVHECVFGHPTHITRAW